MAPTPTVDFSRRTLFYTTFLFPSPSLFWLVWMSVSPRDPSQRRQPSTSSIASSSAGRGPRASERSHMESAVTKLLVATRQLLDALTNWSTGRITETEVSDVYVRLGNDFNSCVSAFQDLDIPMHELLSVPAQLRNCLERCLADDPSPKNLERYLPEIRNTIVSLLQGLKAKQTLYKSMKEEERRKQATAASQAILEGREGREGREEIVADPEEMQRRAVREGELRAREEARLRALERERAAELERTRERERSSGGGLRRDAVERQASSGDGRWVPPQSLHQNQPRGLPAHPTASPTQPPPSGRSSSSSSSYGTPAAGLSPAINLGSPVNSFASPPQPPPHDSDRPFSTMSSSTSSSEGSQAHSLSRRSIYPSSRNRHGPLPDPPADAFRPARRVPSNSNSPSTSSGGGDRTLSVVGGTDEEHLANGRQSSRSPPPPHLQSSKSYPTTQVTRHSLIDPPMPALPPEQTNPAYSPTTSNPLANASARSSSDESRPVVRHSLTDAPSPQLPSTSTYQPIPALPTVITPSPPMPSSEGKLPSEPSPPSPPPPEPLNLAPSPPPPVASVADQTLSALRKSDTNISRRASQRYSTYQIGKIMDVGGGLGIPGTTGSPGSRKSGSRRGSDIGTLGEAGEINGGPLMGGTSPGRPSRAARAPPMPTIPAGVAGSPLRGGGSVPPSEDQGPESREGEGGDVSFSSSASTSTLRPSTSSHILSQQLTPPGQSDLTLPPTISTTGPPHDEHSEPSTPDAISVFLLHGRECKKVLIPAGPTIPSIRLLFMEKFAYSPGGDEFPSIYVRDPKTEWRYEWEEGEELRDGVQLSLNIEPLDQVKQHIDTQMSSLSRKLEDLIRESVAPLSSQFATLQASNNTIQAASNRMSMSISSGTNATPSKPSLSPNHVSPQADRTWNPPPPTITPQPSSSSPSPSTSTSASTVVPATSSSTTPEPASSFVSPTIVADLRNQFDEVQSLRRELGIMRQIHVDGMNTVKETFSRIRKENQRLRDVATTSLGGGRAFVNAGKVKIDLQSQDVLRKVEDLADVVEELHTDVTEKLIVPKPSLMRSLKKDINEAKDQLEDLVKTTSAAATTWRTTWSQEMENVMAEEKQLSHHLAFTVDIQADFKALKDVFDQIEVYAAHRASTPTPNSSHGHGQSSLRSRGGGIGYRPPSPNGNDNNPQSSLSSVLFEIQGAKVDPTKRLKAIENAQRMRERELAEKGSGNELSNQLSEFVDGRKLKKTGGVEETERVRERKNALALRGGVAMPASPSPSMLSPGLERNFSPSGGGASGLMKREGSGSSETSEKAPGGGESPVVAVAVEVGESGVVSGGVDAGVVVIKQEEEEEEGLA
ncbi:actin interacting protein 3-domain-containing protein [Mrakia frigida]|uniref:actin interacting protein 3-domain-containing protein n=1 Tax=Mrakia frigida TaxID=29902 RepID=UPI003FCC04BA